MSDSTPALDPKSAVTVGRIVASHALRGEVKVQPLTDFPERFDRGRELWLDGAPRKVESSRWQQKLVYVKLAGVNSRTDADALRGKELLVPEPAALPDDVFYLHDMIGLKVEDEAGQALGEVFDVLTTGANDVYVVKGESGELLLPAIEDVVKQIDMPNRRMVVELLPGLEFQGPPRPRTVRPTGPEKQQMDPNRLV